MNNDDRCCRYCQTPYSGDLDENGKPFCDCEGSRIAELEAEIARLREAQRWIPVGERLPEAGEGVLVYYDEDAAYGFEHGVLSKLGSFFTEHVTHWMPLPQPPQEAEGS